MKHSDFHFHPTTNDLLDSLESDAYTVLNCINFSLDTWQSWSDRNFSDVQKTILGLIELTAFFLGTLYGMFSYAARWSATVLYCTNIACVPNEFANFNAIALLPESSQLSTQVVNLRNQYAAMTRNELRTIAKQRQLPRYSRMLKTELIEALAA